VSLIRPTTSAEAMSLLSWMDRSIDLMSSWLDAGPLDVPFCWPGFSTNGPSVPRFRLRPVRFGTVTLSTSCLTSTFLDKMVFAMISSGRREASKTSGLFPPSNSYGKHQLCQCAVHRRRLTLLRAYSPPNELMPRSRFFMMHGCSTLMMGCEVTGITGSCSCSCSCSSSVGVVGSREDIRPGMMTTCLFGRSTSNSMGTLSEVRGKSCQKHDLLPSLTQAIFERSLYSLAPLSLDECTSDTRV
jgi:hypothetical protein